MKFLILNGPNLNLLGLREPDIYGKQNYAALEQFLHECCHAEGVECVVAQSNHEGVLVDRIQEAYGIFDGIIINPAAYTHTSVAILDALKGVALPAVEVHLSDISRREAFRSVSYAGMACLTTCKGHGFDSYKEAIHYLKEYLSGKKE